MGMDHMDMGKGCGMLLASFDVLHVYHTKKGCIWSAYLSSTGQETCSFHGGTRVIYMCMDHLATRALLAYTSGNRKSSPLATIPAPMYLLALCIHGPRPMSRLSKLLDIYPTGPQTNRIAKVTFSYHCE